MSVQKAEIHVRRYLVHERSRLLPLLAILRLRAIEEAIAAGADERGYFVWSCPTVSKRTCGYSQRFGLAHVDVAAQRRIPKKSARWYADLIAANRRSPVPAVSRKPQDGSVADG